MFEIFIIIIGLCLKNLVLFYNMMFFCNKKIPSRKHAYMTQLRKKYKNLTNQFEYIYNRIQCDLSVCNETKYLIL